MKILELSFKNLNSLYGEWIIDFTDPNYTSNGIFALIGPTGAGKSTILDAICLALYGKTPRLDKINKSENEIMSRQTGECYAEVLFATQEGLFRCRWEQKRARNNITGNLQNSFHQLSDETTKKLIENKKSIISGIIEEKTGMDFERFTRSVLLAQGGFDSFLRAKDDEKSMILEQLTGSQIYTQISKNVHERKKEENDKLQQLQGRVAGIVILTPEEEKEIELKLSEKQQAEKELKTKDVEVQQALTWLKKLAELKKDIADLKTSEIQINTDIASFKPKRSKLELAKKASAIEVIYSNLTTLRKSQAKDISSHAILDENIPKLKEETGKQKEKLMIAENLTIKAKKDKELASELIKKVRSLDQSIAEQDKRILETSSTIEASEKIIQTKQKSLETEKEKIVENNRTISLIDDYLSLHKADEWLISNLAGVEEQLNTLNIQRQEIQKLELKIKSSDSELQEAVKNYEKSLKLETKQKAEKEKTSQELKQEENSLLQLLNGMLLREYRTKKYNLVEKKHLLEKINSLEFEKERKLLANGEPCPVCGSLSHPYAQDNVPKPHALDQEINALTELITKAEKEEELIKQLENTEKKLTATLTTIEQEKTKAENEQNIKINNIKELNNNLASKLKSYSELETAILLRLDPLAISNKDKTDNQKLLNCLKSRLKNWESKQKEKSTLEKQIAEIRGEVKSLEAVILTHNKDLEHKQNDFKKLTADNKQNRDNRLSLYGDKNPDLEEKLLQEAIDKAEISEKNDRKKSTDLEHNLNKTQEQLESLKLTILQQKLELSEKEKEFLAKIQAKGFKEEQDFKASLLSHDEIDSLSSQAKKLDDYQAEILTRLKDRHKSLNEELSKKLTEKSQSEIETIASEYSKSLELLLQEITKFELTLDNNSKAKEQIKDKQKEIDAQKLECNKWDKLHELIGSNDGKKYRNFAQGLTFELMVSHANQQLREMTDRYLLTRDNNNPLELSVIDNYQAGEIRSTKNLSGGESFLVSLSLALGLSKMASKKVRVDSLFLDEGFGTLDEEALETALESLSGLQQAGKLIGIISHVSALKERISTQISINPISGGRSIIVGPGCKEIKNKES